MNSHNLKKSCLKRQDHCFKEKQICVVVSSNQYCFFFFFFLEFSSRFLDTFLHWLVWVKNTCICSRRLTWLLLQALRWKTKGLTIGCVCQSGTYWCICTRLWPLTPTIRREYCNMLFTFHRIQGHHSETALFHIRDLADSFYSGCPSCSLDGDQWTPQGLNPGFLCGSPTLSHPAA